MDFGSTEYKIFFTFLIAALIFSQWTSWNEQTNFAQTKSVSKNSTIYIDSYKHTTNDCIYYNGHYYPSFNRWEFSFISSAPYFVFSTLGLDAGTLKFLLTFLISGVFFSLSGVLAYKIASYFFENHWKNILASLAYGFSTLAFQQSRLFTTHSAEAFLSLLVIYFILRYYMEERKEVCNYLLMGVLLCVGVLLTPLFLPLALMIIILLLYEEGIKKALLVLSVSLILFTPFYAGFINEVNPNLKVSPLKVIDSSDFDDKKYYPENFAGNSYPFSVLIRILLYPSHGLLFYYPILIFSFFGYFLFNKNRVIPALLFVFSISVVLINALIPMWWFGWVSFGPVRILTIIMPALYVGLLKFIERYGWKIVLPFIVLGLLNNFFLLQYGEDHVTNISRKRYREKMETMKPIGNSLYNHYIPLTVLNGPRSRLIENLVSNNQIDILLSPHSRNVDGEIMEYLKTPLFVSPFGIFTLSLPYLGLYIFLVFVFIVWKKELFSLLRIEKYKKIIYLMIILSFLLFVGVDRMVYTDGWLAPRWIEKNLTVSESRFIGSNASILVFERQNKLNISFIAETNRKNGNLSIIINNKKIGEYFIKDRKKIEKSVKSRKELNNIEFRTNLSCDLKKERKAWEDECIHFKIKDFQVK